MRTLTITLTAVLTFAAAQWPAVDARAASTAAATADASAARIRAHVEFLADDLLEGRAAGSKGYDVAARYVAAQFRLLGLEPGGADGGWLQPIEFVEASPVIPAATLELERDGKTLGFASAEDFLPGIDWFDARSTVTAPLAFVGYGVSAPDQHYDDFAGVDLRGRIAVVLSGAPPTFPSTARAHYSSAYTKSPELVRRGAVGVLTVRTPWDEERVPFARLVQSSWRPGMRWLGADGVARNGYPELKRSATLARAGADKLFAGAPKTLDAVFADAKAGRAGSFELAGRATLAGQTLIARRSSANVIAKLTGSDPTLRDEYVVLTAHLDGLGRGAAVGGDTIYNGAMDNATGVAVMLEVARALAGGTRPKRSVLFLAVTGEERGLLGADYYAENPTVPRAAIVANVNMDMPVALAPLADFVAFGAEHSTLGPIAARAARAEGYLLSPDPHPEEVVFVRSDQYPFVRHGIPALFLSAGTTSRAPGVDGAQLEEDFRRNRYHMPGDDAQQPIHYPSLAGLARVNVRIVREIAGSRARPAWNAGDFFGATYGRPGEPRM